MAELTSVKPVEREVEIKSPGDAGVNYGITWSLMSLDDPRMAALKRRFADDRARKERSGKIFKQEDFDENTVEMLTKATTGWQWGDDPDGEPNTFHGEKPEYSIKNVRAVLTEIEWIRTQLLKEIGDTEAFFANSKPN